MHLQLLKLPSELVVAIAEKAALSDVLQLRRACKALAKICEFPLQHRKRKLYLHPKSVLYAIDLLSDTTWSKYVEEIVLLGNSTSRMRTREPSGTQLPDFRLDYHPWSQFPPTAEGEREMTYSELTHAELNTFEENYASLVEGLARLPKLKTIRYAAKVIDPGFCAVSESTVLEHARSRDTWQLHFGNEGQPRMHLALHTVWWSDAQVFVALADKLRNQLVFMDILQPMPAIKQHRDRDIRGPSILRQQALYRKITFGSNLTKLKIVAPGMQGWNNFLKNLSMSMPGLQALEVVLTSTMDEQSMRFRQTLDLPSTNFAVVWEEDSNRRSRFNLTDFAVGSQSTLRFLSLSGQSSFPYPISTNSILPFLRHHKCSLEHMTLNNIVFYHASANGLMEGNAGAVTIGAGMRTFFEVIRDELDLKSAHVQVDRIGCDEKCRFDTEAAHDAACSAYPAADSWVNVKELDDLAAEMKVELRDDSWDFGQVVLRPSTTKAGGSGAHSAS
ncbi:hypothetical protein AC579_6465 [Pseudocercospora musae]|uniref:F-box domain-containing protein n=1 Tax=Pseudocercospora musae TaxID=113226 RepID=A0A139IK34_9PEZI|nr:hypothetical protein AC579_6465 [Pseudocercospora musae]